MLLSYKVCSNIRSNQITEVEIQIQTPVIVVLMAQSRNFGIFMKLIFSLIPK
jgi:hypothetical protein